MDFDESKHPRDRFGQFTRKALEYIKEHPPVGAKSLSNRRFSRFGTSKSLSYESQNVIINTSKSLDEKIKSITPKEWALYYQFTNNDSGKGAIFYGKDGSRWVRIETDKSNKIIIDDGNNETRKIKDIKEFRNNDTINDVLNELIKRRFLR